MVILNSSFQTPSPMEANNIAVSVHQNNQSANDAIRDYTAREIQKNDTRFQENAAVISAQTSGKGLNLDMRG